MSYQLVTASNQFLEVNNALGISDFPITVSMAVKLASDLSMGLFWMGNSAAANVWAAALAADVTNNYLYAQTRNTGTTSFAQGTTDPASLVGTWANVAARFSNASLRSIWLNGAKEGENTVAQTAGTINRTSIGHFGDSTPALPADARIAYVAIWNAAVADADIQAVHGGTDPRDVDSLVDLWDFSTQSQPLVGLVGGVTLTATGSPTFSSDNPDLAWLAGAQASVQARNPILRRRKR